MKHQTDNPSTSTPVDQVDQTKCEWDIAIPLATNRFFLYDTLKAVFWAVFIFTVGMLILFSFQKGIDSVVPFIRIMAWIFLGFLIAIPGIALLCFRNRYPMHFDINAKGANYIAGSRLAAVSNRVAVAAGLISLRPAIAGAGLIGMSQESGGIAWADVYRIQEHPGQYVITLMNRWRAVLRLYCTRDNYSYVLDLVRSYAATAEQRRKRRDAAQAPKEKVWPRRTLESTVALAFWAAIWACPLEFDVRILLGILACVLLSIWIRGLRRIAAGIGLAGTLWLLCSIIYAGAEKQTLVPRELLGGADSPSWAQYTLFGSFGTGKWIRFVVSCVGLLGLGILAVRVFRKRPG